MKHRIKTVVILPSKKSNTLQSFFFTTSLPLNNNLPSFNAIIHFNLKDQRFRPWKIETLSDAFGPQRVVKSFIFSLRNASRILIYGEETNPSLIGFRRMLKDYQIEKPVSVSLCRHCLLKGKFTELTKQSKFTVRKEKICKNCAENELESLLKVEQIKISPKILKRLKKLLSRVYSVDKLVSMFKRGFDPSRNPEITLYDVKQPEGEQALPEISIQDSKLSPKFIQVLLEMGIKEFTPIQIKSLQAGILNRENLLVVAPTSTGKTLVGEFAGITNALKGNKMVYLSPLVALANQKYEEFQRKYEKIGLKAAIKVGMSRIDIGEESNYIIDTDIRNADLVSATYEAFDALLRNGEFDEIGDVGTVIIDEVQMLGDIERGAEIDGLVGRIKMCFPKAQIIALSATIGNPSDIAMELGLKYISHTERLIPLERHLILSRSENEKLRLLVPIVKSEYKQVSNYGFHGQSIVFTYSRKSCADISKYLKEAGVKVKAYHGGLTYLERKEIELSFEEGKLQSVVTTAALGAGVDFPASQVIFMDLIMGNKWLTVSEFEQFQGRAGRLGKHNRGKVILLVYPERKFFKRSEVKSAGEVAVDLLSGTIEDVEPNWEKENLASQLLAGLCTTKTNDPAEVYNLLLGRNIDLKSLVKVLVYYKMIEKDLSGGFSPTPLGRATAVSFLEAIQGFTIFSDLKKKSVLELAINIEPFRNVYLSNKLQAELNKSLRYRISTRLFSGSILDLMNASTHRKIRKLDRWVLNLLTKWNQEFFMCNHEENPYCDCGSIELSKKIVELRLKGFNPLQISQIFDKYYELYLYPGDILGWLDSVVHGTQSVQRIAEVSVLPEKVANAQKLIQNIQSPPVQEGNEIPDAEFGVVSSRHRKPRRYPPRYQGNKKFYPRRNRKR
ncbi:MAG: DUF5814 domain-containing protein [Candidatus Ranarchaeia archaeon]